MTHLETILLVVNFLTLNLLVMSMRSTKRWISAYRDLDRTTRRYVSKQESISVRRETGGW